MECFFTNIEEISDITLERSKTLLAPWEKTRYDGMSSPERQREFLAGRALLKDVATYYLNIPVSRVEILANPDGSIYIKGYKDYCLTLSHSGKYAICVLSEKPTGIDVEHMIGRDFPSLMKSQFGSEYGPYFDNLMPETQAKEFYLRWTRKESRIKLFSARHLDLEIYHKMQMIEPNYMATTATYWDDEIILRKITPFTTW